MPISICSAMRRQALWPVPIISAVIAGCSNNPPVAAFSGADMAVNQAMNAKASEYAPADLQRAMDKVEAGVDPGRISAAGLGEAYPVASNGTSAGRLQNRRVEIYLPTAGQEGGGRGS